MSVIPFPRQRRAVEAKPAEPRKHAPMVPFTLAINDDLNELGRKAQIWSCYLYLADGLTREQQIEVIRWGLEQYNFPCATEPGDLRLV